MCVMQVAQSGESLNDTVVCIGKVQFVFAIVLEEECVSFGEESFVHLRGMDVVSQRQRPPHEHGSAVADKARDLGVAKRPAAVFGKRCVDAVAQILCGIDESAVEIEHEQLKTFDRQRAKHMDHASSLPKRPQRITRGSMGKSAGKCDDGGLHMLEGTRH